MVSKSREEQLQAWKNKRSTKPLGKLCQNVPFRNLAGLSKPPLSDRGGLRPYAPAALGRADKENTGLGIAEASGRLRQYGGKKESKEPLASGGTTQRWLGDIQGDWDQLSQQLDVLKKHSNRDSVVQRGGDIKMLPARSSTTEPCPLGVQLTLPRESLALPPTPGAPVFEPLSSVEGQNLMALADGLFTEAAFVDLCEKGMNARLQRTRDGATAESRINELAGKKLNYSSTTYFAGSALLHPTVLRRIG